MLSYLRRILPRQSDVPRGPSVREILDKPGDAYHSIYIKGRILDTEETLHFQVFWLRITRFWLLITLALMALAGATYLGYIDIIGSPVYLYGITGASVILSPILAYRQYKKVRGTRLSIRRLKLIHRRRLGEEQAEGGDTSSVLLAQKRYREEVLDVIEQLRENASKNSRIHNRLQGIIIVGSVLASAITTASVTFGEARWLAVGVTAIMGLAAGFSGYYKFHERSFASRQAADAIEREYEAVELRVGHYSDLNEQAAYKRFAEYVERIRDEHDKRQQQLDQHMQVERQDSKQ